MQAFIDKLRPNSPGARIRNLWKQIGQLGEEEAELKKKVILCNELLGLVSESRKIPGVDDVLKRRALAWQGLHEFEKALADLNELILIRIRLGLARATYSSDRSFIKLIRADQRKEAIQQGGEMAQRLEYLKEMGNVLGVFGYHSNPSAEAREDAFFALIEGARDPNTEVRYFADEMLGTLNPKQLLERIITSGRVMSWMSAAAGRALGRTLPPERDGNIQPETCQVNFGELGRGLAFATAGCAYQGYFNIGVPIPKGGLFIRCDSRTQAGGAYSVPVVCDDCGKEFWVVWDRRPF